MLNIPHRAPPKLSPFDIKKGLPNVDIVSHVHTHLDFTAPSEVDVLNQMQYTFGKYVLSINKHRKVYELWEYGTDINRTSRNLFPDYMNTSLFREPSKTFSFF